VIILTVSNFSELELNTLEEKDLESINGGLAPILIGIPVFTKGIAIAAGAGAALGTAALAYFN